MLGHLTVIEAGDGLETYAGRLLAEPGARVIKLEPAGGDPARRLPPFADHGATDAGLPWLVWNAAKRSVCGLSDAETLALVDTADILFTGATRSGLPDFQALAARNPNLIEVAVLPFSEDGPYAGRPATDLTLMAISGLMHSVGDPDRPPLNLPGQQIQALVGIQAATAALLALYARNTTGHGRRATVSAMQAGVCANYRDPVVYAWDGRIGKRTGNQLVRGKSGVRQIWPAKDGFVTWAVVDNPNMVKGMVAAMQAEGFGDQMAAVDWENTLVANAPQVEIARWEAEIEPYFAAHTRADLFKLSETNGLGLSPIDGIDDVLASPHWNARHFWRRIDDGARGLALTIPGPLFSSTVPLGGFYPPSAQLGEGNAEIREALKA